jgi:hypothetical protein
MTNPARAFEQKARKKLALPKHVTTHWPEQQKGTNFP